MPQYLFSPGNMCVSISIVSDSFENSFQFVQLLEIFCTCRMESDSLGFQVCSALADRKQGFCIASSRLAAKHASISRKRI